MQKASVRDSILADARTRGDGRRALRGLAGIEFKRQHVPADVGGERGNIKHKVEGFRQERTITVRQRDLEIARQFYDGRNRGKRRGGIKGSVEVTAIADDVVASGDGVGRFGDVCGRECLCVPQRQERLRCGSLQSKLTALKRVWEKC